MKTIIFLNTALLLFASVAFGEEFVDDFRSAKLEGRLAERGEWQFRDGIASCIADPDLYKQFKNHGPILKWPREFNDAKISFEMKAKDCQRVVFTLNGDGHVFRVTLADERPDAPAGKSKVPTRIIAWATKSSKQNKGDTIKPEHMPDLPAVNGKWVPVQLTVKGKRAILSIGDFQTEINHPALARDKNMVMITFAHGELSVRNFRMTSSGKSAAAAASPNRAKLDRAPTFANVKYGEHERQVFDIWLADTNKPAPLAIYIHGGGFRSGSKETLNSKTLAQLLDNGISVAAINYRYATIAPLPAAHHDARRALQFMRSKADQWNIDKNKVAAFGGSAGAQICMWLAFTDDMANPDSTDPVERESTRLTCVATAGGQTSNGAEFWRKTIGPLLGDESKITSLARALNGETDPEKIRIAMWGAETLEEANEIASRHAALNIVSADDPPIFMSYGMSPTDKLPSDPKRVRGWLIHHVNLGIALKEKMDSLNLEAHLKYPGAKTRYDSLVDFFVDKLRDE